MRTTAPLIAAAPTLAYGLRPAALPARRSSAEGVVAQAAG
jgi:hypothetical protein